jgi:hypothetical protein
LDKKYSEKTAKEDMADIKSKLDSTELKMLAGSMFRLMLQEKNLEEMTYAEILADGKKWQAEQDKLEAEQKILAEKAKAEEENRLLRLSKAIIVSCYDKGYDEYDYDKYITYKFAIHNKSDRMVRAFKGSITFTNLFGDEIKSLSLVYDQPIEAGKEATYNATTDYNQFMDDDKLLRNKDLKDLKVLWLPEKIIFENGDILE